MRRLFALFLSVFLPVSTLAAYVCIGLRVWEHTGNWLDVLAVLSAVSIAGGYRAP